MMMMVALLRIPKNQLTLILVLIYLTTFKLYPVIQSFYLLIVSLGAVVFFDLAFTFLRKRSFFIPFAAMTTGLIIALIVDPTVRWYQIVVVGAIAMGAKNFIRVSDRHIFNPAAIGLYLGGVVFGRYVSWWGVSFQGALELNLRGVGLVAILLLPAWVSMYKMKRWVSVASFLLAYWLLFGVVDLSGGGVMLNRLLDTSVLFFALVMLPEPMTSPIDNKRQLLYGLGVALMAKSLAYASINSVLVEGAWLPDLLTPALLVANSLFFRFR